MRGKLILVGAVALVLALLLTLAPSCGKGEVGPGVTPTPGTPGVTPTPTPQAKTLKMGLIAPLSGAGAGWGVPTEAGAKWAAARINEAGGFKVGADTYVIKIVSCDTRLSNSTALECLTRLVYDEGIRYIVAYHAGALEVATKMTAEEKVFTIEYSASHTFTLKPEMPYRINGFPMGPDCLWSTYFSQMVAKRHPEIKTVALVTSITSRENFHVCGMRAAEEVGWTVVAEDFYEGGIIDFYPILTKFVAKNPDAIGLQDSNPGAMALMIKQARELGYTGVMFAPNPILPEFLIPITGVAAAEGYLNNGPDYSSDLFPEATRALHADYLKRYPKIGTSTTTLAAFVGVNLYVKGIQVAGSTDTDAVRAVFDDPNFRFEFLGLVNQKFGGIETYGIARQMPHPLVLAEYQNGKSVALDMMMCEVP